MATTSTKQPSNFITLRSPTGVLLLEPTDIVAVATVKSLTEYTTPLHSNVFLRDREYPFHVLETAGEVLDIISRHYEDQSLWFSGPQVHEAEASL